VIRDILQGTYKDKKAANEKTYDIKKEGKSKQVPEDESDEDKHIIPHLFSLRKSALY
jgi:hypothetical protein